ncbi:MAG: AAA family ATPase, partial [Planctomycetota bacterium]
MQIDRLLLTAYGGFSNQSLDFADRDDCSLHIIYGPNEAGKSTALRAITSWLFGMPHRVEDNFRHPATQIRVGGVLRRGDETLACLRRRGNRNTLRKLDDKTVIPDQRIADYTRGLTRDAFENQFGISHQSLVAGGREIIHGRGDVGQALFSAGTGLSQISAVMAQLQDSASDLFKPSGSKPHLNAALAELKALTKQRDALQLNPRHYEETQRELSAAVQRVEELDGQQRTLAAKYHRTQRLLAAVSDARRYQEISALLVETPLCDVPHLDDEFSSTRR